VRETVSGQASARAAHTQREREWHRQTGGQQNNKSKNIPSLQATLVGATLFGSTHASGAHSSRWQNWAHLAPKCFGTPPLPLCPTAQSNKRRRASMKQRRPNRETKLGHANWRPLLRCGTDLPIVLPLSQRRAPPMAPPEWPHTISPTPNVCLRVHIHENTSTTGRLQAGAVQQKELNFGALRMASWHFAASLAKQTTGNQVSPSKFQHATLRVQVSARNCL